MDNQTVKSIERSLKSIARSLEKLERNTRPTINIPESYIEPTTEPVKE